MGEHITSELSAARKRDRASRLKEQLIGKTIEVQRVEPGDNELWHQIGRLRARVYVQEHNYLEEANLNEAGEEYDEYDELPDTVHLAVTDDANEVVGYARILAKGPDGERPLPVEKVFKDDLDERDIPIDPDMTEVSRLISAAKRRVEGPLVTAALVRALAHELEDEKYSATTLATLEPFLHTYLNEIIGVPMATLVEQKKTPEYGDSANRLVAIWTTGIPDRAGELDEEGRRVALLPEKMGEFFDAEREVRGLGTIALYSLENVDFFDKEKSNDRT